METKLVRGNKDIEKAKQQENIKTNLRRIE